MQKLELNEHLKLRAYDLHNQFALRLRLVTKSAKSRRKRAQKAPWVANGAIPSNQEEADAIDPTTSERHSSSRISTLFYL